MNQDYFDLKGLAKTPGYQKLEGLWLYQVSNIEEERDKAAKSGDGSAWRYWAGKEKGFKLAMTALARALADLEKSEEEVGADDKVNQMLEELKLKGDLS